MKKKNIGRSLVHVLAVAILAAGMIVPETVSTHAASVGPASGVISSKGGAYMRKGPSKAKKRVTLVKNKAKVKVLSEHYTSKTKTNASTVWYYVQYGKKKGYIRSDLVKIKSYKLQDAWTNDDLNIRVGPGTSMKRKATLKKNAQIQIAATARAAGTKDTWYKIKYGKKYYYVNSKWATFTAPETPEPLNAVYKEEPLVVTQSEASKAVANAAVKWAIKIADDNSFHYGNGKHAHHNGCYFCGTQPSSKKKYVVQYQKTYCCNPFVHAAYAHGGGDQTMLNLCKRGGSYDWNSYKTASMFRSVGHPAMSELLPGDVLCVTGHVAMYVGNGKIVEASGGDDGKPGSTKWNNSISVSTMSTRTYNWFTHVYRYVGKN